MIGLRGVGGLYGGWFVRRVGGVGCFFIGVVSCGVVFNDFATSGFYSLALCCARLVLVGVGWCWLVLVAVGCSWLSSDVHACALQ